MGKAIATHDKLVRSLVAANHGYEVTTEGDAFTLAFHSSLDAVSFCFELQRRLLVAYKSTLNSLTLKAY